MKILSIAAAAVALIASVGFANAADFEFKYTNSQGSKVGQASSAGTGNGAIVGGNGTIEGEPLGSDAYPWATDQTTFPGSRADAVQALHAAEGRGRNK